MQPVIKKAESELAKSEKKQQKEMTKFSKDRAKE